jgi:hypothetical protein
MKWNLGRAEPKRLRIVCTAVTWRAWDAAALREALRNSGAFSRRPASDFFGGHEAKMSLSSNTGPYFGSPWRAAFKNRA